MSDPIAAARGKMGKWSTACPHCANLVVIPDFERDEIALRFAVAATGYWMRWDDEHDSDSREVLQMERAYDDADAFLLERERQRGAKA